MMFRQAVFPPRDRWAADWARSTPGLAEGTQCNRSRRRWWCLRRAPRGLNSRTPLSDPPRRDDTTVFLASPILNTKVIIERAAAPRLPAIYQWPEAAEEGPRRVRPARRRDFTRGEAGWPAGRAADQLRAGHQSPDREGDRSWGFGRARAARRQVSRMNT